MIVSSSVAVSDKESIDAFHETVKSGIEAMNRSEAAMRRLTSVGLAVAIVGVLLAALQAYAALFSTAVQCTQRQPVPNVLKK